VVEFEGEGLTAAVVGLVKTFKESVPEESLSSPWGVEILKLETWT